MTTREAMTERTWRTTRLALQQAWIAGHITDADYYSAMTEVMGTSDRNQW